MELNKLLSLSNLFLREASFIDVPEKMVQDMIEKLDDMKERIEFIELTEKIGTINSEKDIEIRTLEYNNKILKKTEILQNEYTKLIDQFKSYFNKDLEIFKNFCKKIYAMNVGDPSPADPGLWSYTKNHAEKIQKFLDDNNLEPGDYKFKRWLEDMSFPFGDGQNEVIAKRLNDNFFEIKCGYKNGYEKPEIEAFISYPEEISEDIGLLSNINDSLSENSETLSEYDIEDIKNKFNKLNNNSDIPINFNHYYPNEKQFAFNIPINLDGTKILDKITKDIIKYKLDPEIIKELNLENILFECSFYNNNSKHASENNKQLGLYRPKGRQVLLFINTDNNYSRKFNIETIKHELIHFTQDIYDDWLRILNNKNIIKNYNNYSAGTPSKNTWITKKLTPSGKLLSKEKIELEENDSRIKHEVRPIEFYSRLHDSVEKFKDNKILPFELSGIAFPTMEPLVKETIRNMIIKKFIGLNTDKEYNTISEKWGKFLADKIDEKGIDYTCKLLSENPKAHKVYREYAKKLVAYIKQNERSLFPEEFF